MKFNLIILVAAYVFLTGCDEKKSTTENKNDAEREVLGSWRYWCCFRYMSHFGRCFRGNNRHTCRIY